MTAQRGGILRIASILRTVPDLEAAVAFYGQALDCEPCGPAARLSNAECALIGVDGSVMSRTLHLGRQHITLVQFDPPGRAYPPESTSTDLWFQHCAVVVGTMEPAHARVTAAGALPISAEPQLLPPNTGGVTAFKFRDPFGHPMELLSFPEGVGDPAWHGRRPRLFLGIDHTAISVSDADASRSFYAEVGDFEVKERTLNRGAAQARLDAVPDDVVEVVALAPAEAPPHLELLAYRTGSRRRIEAAPSDAAVSRTLAVGDVDGIAERLVQRGHAVRLGTWNDRPAIAFADPDGHAWICQAA